MQDIQKIKQTFKNINTKGGIANILKDVKTNMKRNSVTIQNISFPKDGSKVDPYKGSVKIVYY